MFTNVLLIMVVIVLLGILFALKNGFNEVIKGLEAINESARKGDSQ